VIRDCGLNSAAVGLRPSFEVAASGCGVADLAWLPFVCWPGSFCKGLAVAKIGNAWSILNVWRKPAA
jgi:hypothetical protein